MQTTALMMCQDEVDMNRNVDELEMIYGAFAYVLRGLELFIYNWYKIDTCFEVLLSFTVVTSIV